MAASIDSTFPDEGPNFPPVTPLVNDCQFGVSPVNYSDSDSGPN